MVVHQTAAALVAAPRRPYQLTGATGFADEGRHGGAAERSGTLPAAMLQHTLDNSKPSSRYTGDSKERHVISARLELAGMAGN